MDEFTRDEELAALKVLKKRIDERLEVLEAPIKRDLLEAYGDDGIDSKRVEVGGYKVGGYTVVPAKLKPVISPGREAEALEFLGELGLTETVPAKGWERYIANIGGKAVHTGTGQMTDSIEFAFSKLPYIRATGFKDEDVLDAFQARGIASGDVLRLLGGPDA